MEIEILITFDKFDQKFHRKSKWISIGISTKSISVETLLCVKMMSAYKHSSLIKQNNFLSL
jgi:hypothetical protein